MSKSTVRSIIRSIFGFIVVVGVALASILLPWSVGLDFHVLLVDAFAGCVVGWVLLLFLSFLKAEVAQSSIWFTVLDWLVDDWS